MEQKDESASTKKLIVSIMCNDVDCPVRFHEKSPLFVCQCVSTEEADLFSDEQFLQSSPIEFSQDTEHLHEKVKLKRLIDRGYLDICYSGSKEERTKDSVENIRIIECHGLKCRAKFGDNIQIHCESCFGHVIKQLRS